MEGLRAVLSPCPQLEDNWQDVTSLADTNNGVLMLHNVNKSSSGLYKCQTLNLDEMTQHEGDVELMVNCKAGGQDTVHCGWYPLPLLMLPCSPSLS